MTTLISSFGSKDANTYCLLTQAHSIITSHALEPSAWTESSTGIREAALLTATRQLDALPWLGERSCLNDSEQALAFPRTAVGLPRRLADVGEEASLEAQEITLAHACAMQALALLAHTRATSEVERVVPGVERYAYRLGPLSENFVYKDAATGTFEGLSAIPRAILSDFPRARRITRV